MSDPIQLPLDPGAPGVLPRKNRRYPLPPGSRSGAWIALDPVLSATSRVRCESACCGAIATRNWDLARRTTRCRSCDNLDRCESNHLGVSHTLVAFYRHRHHSMGRRHLTTGYSGFHYAWHRVHPGWRLLADFIRYCVTLPNWDNQSYQMDRIDTHGDYVPGNIRFVTPRTNCNNRRTSIRLASGELISDYATANGIKYKQAYYLYRQGRI